MRALIVDDEKHVREAVKLLVDWESFAITEIFEATDGLSAIELIQEQKPELIFTDMLMPGKNGMELMEWIHEHAPTSKMIVISGHDDFSLVRHAVKFGGTDYILKPIDADQLGDAVHKAVTELERDEQSRLQNEMRNIEMNQIKPVYWDKMFSNLIADPATYYQVSDKLEKEFGLSKEIVKCQVVLLSIGTLEPSLRQKFSSHMELLFFSLINICNEFVREKNVGFAFRNVHSSDEIIILLWSDLSHTAKLIEEIGTGIRRTLHGRLHFAVGPVEAFPKGLHTTYKDAQKAMRARNLLNNKQHIHFHSSNEQESSGGTRSLQFSDYEEDIRLALRSGSTDQVNQAVSKWFDAIGKLSFISAQLFENWLHEYRIIRNRWAKELNTHSESAEDGMEKVVFLPLDEEGRLSIRQWQSEMTKELHGIARQMLEQQHKENHVIYSIAQYIEEHYHEDIQLQDVSNLFFLSREYISRKFKSEFNVGFSDYLGRVRIDKAKLLLLNPNLRITQVAEMVGYQDEKYFSKVFKKMEGISPNEFRKATADKG